MNLLTNRIVGVSIVWAIASARCVSASADAPSASDWPHAVAADTRSVTDDSGVRIATVNPFYWVEQLADHIRFPSSMSGFRMVTCLSVSVRATCEGSTRENSIPAHQWRAAYVLQRLRRSERHCR